MNVMNGKPKQRIISRISWYNRLSFPVLFNAWEQEGIDREFEIVIIEEKPGPEFYRPGDVVLFSFMTPDLPEVCREVAAIKNRWKSDVLVAAGGPHVTGEQELAFMVGFDVLFVGPAERNFARFGRDLLDNKGPRMAAGKTVYRVEPAHLTTDEFNTFLPVSRYFATVPPLEIMRGCYWHCRYCSTHLHDVVFREKDSIVSYLVELKRRGMKRVNYVSPSSMEYGAGKGRALVLGEIRDLLDMTYSYDFVFIEYGIFPSEVRPDSVTGEGLDILKKYVSNKYITIGAQSGSDARLRELRRGHDTEGIENAVAIANEKGFRVHLDFIVGYPGETAEERRETLEYIKRLNKTHTIRTHLHHFIPLSGSPYGFRLPSFLPESAKQELVDLKKAGIAVGGWIQNEKQCNEFFDWMRKNFPGYYDRYC